VTPLLASDDDTVATTPKPPKQSARVLPLDQRSRRQTTEETVYARRGSHRWPIQRFGVGEKWFQPQGAFIGIQVLKRDSNQTPKNRLLHVNTT
jgi:hypothetical protein